MTAIGIKGLGIYLPEDVRTNDWWPRSIVEKWEQRAVMSSDRMHADKEWRPGERIVLDAMKQYARDPFRGAVERRVLNPAMQPSEMELVAAREAIADAGISPADVDCLLTYSIVPDELECPNAFPLHETLGLSPTCFTLGVEGTCNSFLLPLTVAEQMIAGGRFQNVLVVQSCAISRILPADDPQSAWFGDAAGAIVVSRVASGFGLLGTSHRTESKLHRAVVTTVPGRKWYEEGRTVLHAKDRSAAFQIMVGVADNARTVVDESLARAGVRADAVDFFACHQVSPWMRPVVQEFVGLTRSRSIDTFRWLGNMGAANLPVMLYLARKERLLKSGDLVVMHGGGAGATISSIVARWGTG